METVDDLRQYSRWDLLRKSVDHPHLKRRLGTRSIERIKEMLTRMDEVREHWDSMRARNSEFAESAPSGAVRIRAKRARSAASADARLEDLPDLARPRRSRRFPGSRQILALTL